MDRHALDSQPRRAHPVGMDELTTSIVGIDHPNADKSKSNRRMEILLCAPGEAVELRPEPKNPYDAHAVGVWSTRGVQMGYISAERAPFVGKRLKGEETHAVFQALLASGAYIRIRFGGGQPSLPAATTGSADRSSARPAHDPDVFYPDDAGPEWGA